MVVVKAVSNEGCIVSNEAVHGCNNGMRGEATG